MRILIIITLFLVVLEKGCEIADQAHQYAQEQKAKPKPNLNVVAYDWGNYREITQQMADTMVCTGGKWYGKSNLPKKHGISYKQAKKEPQWLNPTGKEKELYDTQLRKRQWRKEKERQQRENDEWMDSKKEFDREEIIREIVEEEIQRR